jgi:hypothetical protein
MRLIQQLIDLRMQGLNLFPPRYTKFLIQSADGHSGHQQKEALNISPEASSW